MIAQSVAVPAAASASSAKRTTPVAVSVASEIADLDAEIAEREQYGAEAVWGSVRDDFQKFKNAYNTERNKAYNNAYENSFNTVITKSSLNISESTETGQIKGTFKTNSDTVSSIGTEAQLDAVASSALTTANATGDSVGGTSWTAAFNQAYAAGYASSVGNSTVKTDSEVLVLGLGAIASVNTDTKSMFSESCCGFYEYCNGGNRCWSNSNLRRNLLKFFIIF